MTDTTPNAPPRTIHAVSRWAGAAALGVLTAGGCSEPSGRAQGFPTLGDDALIQDIDRNTELRTTVIELPEVGEVEVLYAVRDGKAIWTGDILLGDANDLEQGFRAATLTSQLWPNKTLKFKYGATLTAGAKSVLDSAMAQWESSTSIRFVELPAGDGSGYVQFSSGGDGCFASIGYPGDGNSRELNLGSGCEFETTALHELGHALGVFHEQTRADRDTHVDIDWTNITAGMASDFDKYSKSGLAGTDRGAYDYDSIMHYGSDAFAKDPSKPVITKKGGGLIPWPAGLSAGDISAVEAMYAGMESDGDDAAPAPDEGEKVPGSCENRCSSEDAVPMDGGGTCFCDAGCTEYGDCCGDREMHCGGDAPSPDDADDDADADADDAAGTCAGSCGSDAAQQTGTGQECYCDELCTNNGDCCTDFVASCGGGEGPGPGDDDGPDDSDDAPGSCSGSCGGAGSQGDSCHCDDACVSAGDCCSDFVAVCGGSGTCEGSCGADGDQGGCFCEPSCVELGDCCGDYAALCGG